MRNIEQLNSLSPDIIMALPADYYRAAQILIDLHGNDAEAHARAKLDKFMNAENPVAAAAWRLVIAGLEELRNRTPIILH